MIDHIVYTVPELQAGIKLIHEKLGVEPIYGGKHNQEGTHNALVKLGKGCYLEIIAPDPENNDIDPPRWMGVDLIKQPCITRWAVKSSDIQSDIKHISALNNDLGRSKEGQRVTSSQSLLKWQLSVPLAKPLVEPIPFLIDWKDSDHPSDHLEDTCRIESFELFYQKPEKLSKILFQLGIEQKVTTSTKSAIHLTVQCPNGIVKL